MHGDDPTSEHYVVPKTLELLKLNYDAPTQDKENVVVVCSEWGSGVKCGACHEVLKKTWDNDSDAWVFRGVICLEASSTGRPSLVHQKCHQGSASLPS